MAIICPDCGEEYDVTLFEYGKNIKCSCGKVLKLENKLYANNYNFFKDLLSKIQAEAQAEQKENQFNILKRKADKICSMILNRRYPKVDIQIAVNKFHKEFVKHFPRKEKLYKMIYESRFNRLFEQFRNGENM